MSDTETMKLVAQVVDQFSKPLVDMQRQLAKTAEILAKMNKTGAIGAKAHAAEMFQFKKAAVEAGNAVSGVLTPAMSSFGLTSLTVAGAVATASKAVVDFTKYGRGVTSLARETGATTEAVQKLGIAFQLAGGTQEQFNASFEDFADEMRDFAAGGPRYQALAVHLGKGFEGFAEQIRHAGTPTQQLAVAMRVFAHAGTQAREEMVKYIPYLAQYRGLGEQEILQIQARSEATNVLSAAQLKLADQSAATWARISVGIDRVKNELGDELVPMILKVTKLFEYMTPSRIGERRQNANSFMADVAGAINAATGQPSTFNQRFATPADVDTMTPEQLQGHAAGGHVIRDHIAMVHQGEDIIPFDAPGGNPLKTGQSSAGDAVQMIAVGTRKGVYDGLWDFYNSKDTEGDGAGGAFKKASLTTGGGGGGAEPRTKLDTSPMGTPDAPGAPSKGDPRGMLALVRQEAIKAGIDPDIAEKVARSEGLAGKFAGGDGGTSFGAMQLHRGGPGSVGSEYEKQTGHSLSDPKNEPEQIKFAMQWAAKHGWGHNGRPTWSGAYKQGITERMGITNPDDTKKRFGGELGQPGGAPNSILKEAEQYAPMGPGAVQQFMRSKGYRMDDAWCGDFAAMVITRAGGTPPKNPAIASNWRTYGVHDDQPRPGDIAVRNTGRTGSPGSHVAIVESVDKDGRVHTIGGNQGRMRGILNPRNYEFRHGELEQKAEQHSELESTKTHEMHVHLESGLKLTKVAEKNQPDGWATKVTNRSPSSSALG
jgi:uncharacterized protein (TIGR02594 family)